MRLAFGAPVIVIDRSAQRLALGLRRKRDHRRRAAAGCRTRAGLEVVGHLHRRRHRLVEVAVGIDTARGHDTACRIDLLPTRRQIGTQADDAAAPDADVSREAVAGRRHLGAPHDQIEGEITHLRLPDGARPGSGVSDDVWQHVCQHHRDAPEKFLCSSVLGLTRPATGSRSSSTSMSTSWSTKHLLATVFTPMSTFSGEIADNRALPTPPGVDLPLFKEPSECPDPSASAY